MTDNYIEEYPQQAKYHGPPILVEVTKMPSQGSEILTEADTAELASYMTWQNLPDVSSGLPLMILQRQTRRHRAIVSVAFLTGGASPGVLIDYRPDTIAHGLGQGAVLFAGQSVVLENKRALYVVTFGAPTAVAVTVIEEIFAATPLPDKSVPIHDGV